MEDAALKLEDYLARVSALTEAPLLFTGDGVRPHGKRIREILGERASFAPGPFCYLRPPNAEKNKKLLEAMRHG